MNAPAPAIVAGIISKAEFARRRNVSPGRVSQWISEGKITGDALVGVGRDQRINEPVAVEQLRQRLDISQSLGNGLGTQLTMDAPAAPAPAVDPAQSAAVVPFPAKPNTLEDQIKRNRLEQLQRQNREGARQEAVEAGRLTDAAQVRQTIGREVGSLLTRFEGALSDFATALSAEFKIPQRDALHLLRTQFRKFRAAASADVRAAADQMPTFVDIEIGEEETAAVDLEDNAEEL